MSLSQIRRIYCGCAGCAQIFRSFSGKVEKGRQLRSRAFGVLTYSVYAPRAKSPAALLDGLFQPSPFSLNSHHYSPQTIETSDSTQHPLVTIAHLGQAPRTEPEETLNDQTFYRSHQIQVHPGPKFHSSQPAFPPHPNHSSTIRIPAIQQSFSHDQPCRSWYPWHLLPIQWHAHRCPPP